MKTISQQLKITGLSTLFCLLSVASAFAQRGGGGGGHSGGGGGGHSSGGGGGGHSSDGGGGGHFSGGGGGHYSGGGRSTAGFQRSGGTSQRSVSGISNASGRSYAQGQRSVSGIGTRGGVGFNNRSYAGGGRVGGVRGYGHAGYNGIGRGGRGYFYSRGYYSSLYYPRLGFSCGFLPYGYYPFYWGDYPYYLSDGYYYTYNNDQYTIVEPPVGASITTLPANAQSIVINGQQYYEKNGVYYQAITQADGSISYQIAGKDGQLTTGTNGTATVTAPKVGDITTTLPADSKKINLAGKLFWVSPDGIYYQETTDTSNNTVYKIIGLEDSTPGN